MTKLILDLNSFKALASETRLDILRSLDGKKMSLNDISKKTSMNKTTIHEHLTKLNAAGLVKRKERQGHKWVYYNLTWKGSSLLHPENTKVVVLFAATIITLISGMAGLVNYVTQQLTLRQLEKGVYGTAPLNETLDNGRITTGAIIQNPLLLYVAIICMILFIILLTVSVWRYRINKTQKL